MKPKLITLLLGLWLCSLTACSTPQPIAINQTLPALPACPPKPAITWQAQGDRVALGLDEAIQLRDWLVLQDAWQEAISGIWNLYYEPKPTKID